MRVDPAHSGGPGRQGDKGRDRETGTGRLGGRQWPLLSSREQEAAAVRASRGSSAASSGPGSVSSCVRSLWVCCCDVIHNRNHSTTIQACARHTPQRRLVMTLHPRLIMTCLLPRPPPAPCLSPRLSLPVACTSWSTLWRRSLGPSATCTAWWPWPGMGATTGCTPSQPSAWRSRCQSMSPCCSRC